MPGLDDYQRGRLIKALVFGKFKIGKTAGAGTFPRPNFLEFDDGIATLKNPMLAGYEYSKRGIMYETFLERNVTPKGVIRGHNAFDDACRYFDACMSPTTVKYKSPVTQKEYDVNVDMFDTWVIDSGTTLSMFAKNKALVLLGTAGKYGKNALSNTHAAALQDGLIVPKKQDFGAERSLVEQFVEMVKATDKHVLLLCHEKEEWEGEGVDAHATGIVPLFTGQSAEIIPLKFDEIYNLRIKPEGTGYKRYLQTVPDGLRNCGTRLGLPDGTPFEYDKIKTALNL